MLLRSLLNDSSRSEEEEEDEADKAAGEKTEDGVEGKRRKPKKERFTIPDQLKQRYIQVTRNPEYCFSCCTAWCVCFSAPQRTGRFCRC